MKHHSEKKIIILPAKPSVDDIRSLLTGSGVVELHFKGSSELDRLQELKNLYQKTKKECHKISPDIYLRKTYYLKASTITAAAEYMKQNNLEQQLCITNIMAQYVNAFNTEQTIPLPADFDNTCEYKRHSYRVLGSVLTNFCEVCKQQHVSASSVLQTLLDNFIPKKGE